MSKKKVLAVAAVLLAGGAAIAVSAPGQRFHDRMMDRWHGDGPGHGFGMNPLTGPWRGSLTREAFDERVRERFARFDANSDGVIDAAELESALARRHRGFGHRHGGKDKAAKEEGADKDQARRGRSVTKSEFLDNVRRRFAMLDLDGDGKITDADLPPTMRDRGVLTGEQRGRRGGRMFAFLRGADADKDGAISLDEAVKAAGDRFDRMDRTKDGTLDRADRDALRKEMTDYRVKRVLHRYGATAEGRISREQAFKVAGDMFARLDRNSDGTISRDERPRWAGRHGGHERRMWRGRDRDRNDEPAQPAPEQKKI